MQQVHFSDLEIGEIYSYKWNNRILTGQLTRKKYIGKNQWTAYFVLNIADDGLPIYLAETSSRGPYYSQKHEPNEEEIEEETEENKISKERQFGGKRRSSRRRSKRRRSKTIKRKRKRRN